MAAMKCATVALSAALWIGCGGKSSTAASGCSDDVGCPTGSTCNASGRCVTGGGGSGGAISGSGGFGGVISGSGGSGGAISGSGGSGGAACTVPLPGQMDGLYLLTLSPVIKPEQPLLFRTTVTSEATSVGLSVRWSLEPLDRSDRKTVVGAPIALPPYSVASDGSFTAMPGTLEIDGQANPLTGSDLTLEIVGIRGQHCDVDSRYCGGFSGAVTKPIPLQLDGSTWTLERMPDPVTNPSPIQLNCTGDIAAAPPQ